MASTEWYRAKADALHAAWVERYGEAPPLNAIVLALGVAIHETRAGDAWPGEHNWGATTLRPLNAGELAAVGAAGLKASIAIDPRAPDGTPFHAVQARRAFEAIKAAGLPLPQGAIHCDSKPVVGKGNIAYFTWFAAFDNDKDGAKYFLGLLCDIPASRGGGHKAAFEVLLRKGSTEFDLASAMYRAGYFTGFRDPSKCYAQVNGKWQVAPEGIKGSDLNIREYAAACARATPAVSAALQGWTPVAYAAPVAQSAQQPDLTQPEHVARVQFDLSQTIDWSARG